MKEVRGIVVESLPYQQLKLIGILLFSAYPSTIVYKDEKNYPVIKEWADCNEDNTINRYYYYSVNKHDLKKFIDGDISHSDLIENSIDGFVYFQDEINDQAINTLLVASKAIPYNYRPNSDFVFDDKDGVDTDLIIMEFGLFEFEVVKEIIPFTVKNISKKENSETLYIHLKKNGKGVGYGTVKTEILGTTLLCVDKLYKNVALDHLKTKDRGELQPDAKRNEGLVDYTDTEIFGYGIAASFGIMIRPMVSHIDIFPIKTPALEIAEKVINLINKTKEPEQLKEEYQLHSKFTQNAYEQLLVEIYKDQLDIDVNWYNPKNENQFSASIDYLSANKIIEGIKELSISNDNDIPLVGKFREINCDTGHFVFNNTKGDKYTGHFNEELKETINQFNFIQVYKIIIKRTIEKEAGKGEKIVNTIISCYLDT